MKKLLFLIPFFLNAQILSDLNKKELSLQKHQLLEESQATKKSWINPVILKYSVTQDNIQSKKTITKSFSINVNQPIFKSGAIYYSIKYADDLKRLNINNLILKKRELIKNAYSLAYDYKITLLNKKILELKIKNALIDVKKRREEYKNGTLDLSFLNNAIISLNSLKLSLEDIKNSLTSIKFNFKNISDADITKVNLKLFKIIPLNHYLSNNLDLESKKISQKVNNDLYKMQVGNSLITVSLNGSWNYQDVDYDSKILKDDKDNFYSVGVGISIPFDVTAKNNIQKTKLNFLVSKFDYLQKKRELINEYKKTIFNIETFKRKIKIYEDNIKLYDGLIKDTKNSILAGSATEDDLKILENSKKTNLIQIKILKLQIQKELLNLYYKLKNFSN